MITENQNNIIEIDVLSHNEKKESGNKRIKKTTGFI